MGCCQTAPAGQDPRPSGSSEPFTGVGPAERSSARAEAERPGAQPNGPPEIAWPEPEQPDAQSGLSAEAREHCDDLLAQVIETATRLQEVAEEHQQAFLAQVVPQALPRTCFDRRNGVALVNFGAAEASRCSGSLTQAAGSRDREASLGRMQHGDDLEILRRNAGGWAYCCSSSGTAGWVPADHIAELAAVLAEHDAEGADTVLSVKAGDILEVVIRHYSGWSFCREWLGVEHATKPRREGWVTDTFLEDRIAELSGVTRFQRAIIEAMARVAQGARQMRGLAAAVREGPAATASGRLLEDWVSQCLECVTVLSEELEAVARAASSQQSSSVVPGRRVQARHGMVTPGGPHELQLAEGEHFLVLHVEGMDWAWCVSETDGRDGWVPRGMLEAVGQDGGPLPEATTVPPAAPPVSLGSAALCAPLCAICLEPLSLGDSREALPCAHAFHRGCLGPWLLQKTECPLCRAPCGHAVLPTMAAAQQSTARPRPSGHGQPGRPAGRAGRLLSRRFSRGRA